jgi:cytochrome c
MHRMVDHASALMKSAPLALTLSLLSGVCLADAAQDAATLAMARDRGCMACHTVDRAAVPNITPAQAPAWRDLAARYKSVKGAQQELTARIMTGSSGTADRSTSYANHWGDQVSGGFMPSHRSAVSQAEAAQLVAFILALDPKN